MRRFVIAILFLFPSFTIVRGQSAPPIIPIPVQVEDRHASYEISPNTAIVIADGSLRELASRLSSGIAQATGISVPVQINGSTAGAIVLALNGKKADTLGEEGYDMVMEHDGVRISANALPGLFYGIQSFLQLIPNAVDRTRETVPVPCYQVRDYPRFAWRGLMLDVSRHFFSKQFVLKYLDEMAKHKLNVFHWHLTDDNGWRIEIKGLPQLTDIGAWRVKRTGTWASLAPQPGEPATYGGYYTQEDIKEIVQYAKDRFIRVIPEVDVPGHSLALIASLPHLSCSGETYSVGNGAGMENVHNVLCAANDSVYTVLDLIFSQIAELFPDAYIHTGGDEVNYTFWNAHSACKALMEEKQLPSAESLQGYFFKRMQDNVRVKGKHTACWYSSYLAEPGLLDKETVVYAWTSHEEGAKLSRQGYQVVMTPSRETYLDFAQGVFSSEPVNVIPAIVRLKHCYDFTVVPEGGDEAFILGGQGNLWTESVPTERHVEYMTWPRALALSEAFWSPVARKNWEDFFRRVENRMVYFDRADINYAKSMYNPIIAGMKDENGKWQVKLDSEAPGTSIYYTFDGTNVDHHSARYEGKPLEIPLGASQVRAVCYRNGERIGQQVTCMLHEFENMEFR